MHGLHMGHWFSHCDKLFHMMGLLGLEGWGWLRKCSHYIREYQCFACLSLLQVLDVVSLVLCSLFSSLSFCSCDGVLSSGAAAERYWPLRSTSFWSTLDEEEDRRHTPLFACSLVRLVRLFVVALT